MQWEFFFAQAILRTMQISMKEEARFFLSLIPIFFFLLILKSGMIWAIFCVSVLPIEKLISHINLEIHDSLSSSELFLIFQWQLKIRWEKLYI